MSTTDPVKSAITYMHFSRDQGTAGYNLVKTFIILRYFSAELNKYWMRTITTTAMLNSGCSDLLLK
jgi:hypothetical protein